MASGSLAVKMPELPEVETIVRGLNQEVRGRKIMDVWTDWPGHFSRHKGGFKHFRSTVRGTRINDISRIGKNIIFEVSGSKIIIMHLRMTGRLFLTLRKSHFLRADSYIHTAFFLSGGRILAFSDVRKFGDIFILKRRKSEILAAPQELGLTIGPDALRIKFNELESALLYKKTVIKKALLDQKVIAGIGNIYADEILFTAGIYPLRRTSELSTDEIRSIFAATRKILRKAIKLKGTSMSDYRDIYGRFGRYYDARLVYAREGERCPQCGTRIRRIKIGGRSTYFCEECQN